MDINRIKIASAFLKKVYRKYKLQIIILISLGFFGGLLEGLGIGALVPLFSFVSGGDGIGQDTISRIINKVFSVINLHLSPWTLVIMISALFIFKAIALFVFSAIRTKIVADFENELRSDLYKKTLLSDWKYLLKQKLGHLENALMTDVASNVKLFESSASAVLDLTNLAMYIFVAFSISSFVTAIALTTGGVLLILFKPLIARTKMYANKQVALNKVVKHSINENVSGLKTVKVLGVEHQVSKVVLDLFDRMRFFRIRRSLIKYFSTIAIQPASIIFIGIIFVVSYTRPDFNFAAFIAVIYLIDKIFVYVDRMQTTIHSIYESIPFLQSTAMFQDEVSKNQEIDNGKKDFQFNNSLEFKNVSFAYSSDRKVFDNINLKINKGEMIGIVGPSGVGKTTMVDLLLRLFDPHQGEILVDGKSIKDIKVNSWRRNVGYVSQDVFLKNDTIANNIKFFDDRVSDTDMEEAAKISNIYDSIKKMPAGFGTMSGERGNLFSGGERQRVALARVLARKPEILVLDEATSTLDNESEAFVKASLEKLRGGLTIIVIAHRLSTVLDADRIIAIDKGGIIEEGNPKQLLKKKDSYFYKAYNINK